MDFRLFIDSLTFLRRKVSIHLFIRKSSLEFWVYFSLRLKPNRWCCRTQNYRYCAQYHMRPETNTSPCFLVGKKMADQHSPLVCRGRHDSFSMEGYGTRSPIPFLREGGKRCRKSWLQSFTSQLHSTSPRSRFLHDADSITTRNEKKYKFLEP